MKKFSRSAPDMLVSASGKVYSLTALRRLLCYLQSSSDNKRLTETLSCIERNHSGKEIFNGSRATGSRKG